MTKIYISESVTDIEAEISIQYSTFIGHQGKKYYLHLYAHVSSKVKDKKALTGCQVRQFID